MKKMQKAGCQKGIFAVTPMKRAEALFPGVILAKRNFHDCHHEAGRNALCDCIFCKDSKKFLKSPSILPCLVL